MTGKLESDLKFGGRVERLKEGDTSELKTTWTGQIECVPFPTGVDFHPNSSSHNILQTHTHTQIFILNASRRCA